MDYNQGISDEEFRGILSSLSGWYDRHGYLNMLKLLYQGLVTEPDKLYAATNVIEVFELLCTCRCLSSADLTVLYDTINVTQPFGLEPEIRKFSMVKLLDIRTVSISKFTCNRQILMKVVKCLSDHEVVRISQLYSCQQPCNRWELFVDLEQRSEFSEENLDNFMRNLTTDLIIDSNKDPLGLRQPGNMDSATREANTRTSTDVPSNHHILFDEPSNKSIQADDKQELMECGDEDVGTRVTIPEEILVTGDLDVGTRDAGPEELTVTGDLDFGTKEADVGKLMETGDEDVGTREAGQKKLMVTGDADVWAKEAGQGKLMETGDADVGAKEAGQGKLMETGDADVGAKESGQEKLMETGDADVGAKECGQGKLMETGDADVGAKEAGQGKLMETGAADVGAKECGQEKQMETGDADVGARVDNVCNFTTMVVNQGSVTISGSNIGCIYSVVNLTQVPSNQEASATYDEVIRKYLQERQQGLLSKAHLLTPPTWNSEFQIDLNHLFTDLVLLKNNRKDKDKEKKQCTLKEFLDVVRTYDSCKILVEGDGGMGKTTLLKHIAYHSTIQQNDETFNEKVVFFINVRDIEAGEDILDAIIKQINLKDFNRKTKLKLKDKDVIQDFILDHDHEIVLLLDGYDELEASTEDPIINIFKNVNLKQCKVILTSRSGKLAEFIKSCDVHVMVKGFDQTNSKQFIKRFFSLQSKKSLGKSLTRKIFNIFPVSEEEYDNYYSWLFEMCRSPMLLLLICIMWRDKQCLPDNNTDLFKEIFKCILNQFTRNSDDEEKVCELSDISSKFKNAMLLLGECIYKNLKQNKLSIAKKELKASKDEIEFALKLGFVYEDSPISEHHFKKFYTTSHKLLSEALAGFYLCNASQQCSFNNEEWEEMRCNTYLHNTRVFAIGFLGKDAYKLLKHWVTMKDTSFWNLAKYFEHVKNEDKEKVLMLLDEHLNHIFETRTLTTLNKSLRQFIAYCSSGSKKTSNNWNRYSSVLTKYPRQRFAYHSKAGPDGNDHFIKSIIEINNRQINIYDIVDWIQSLSSAEEKNLGRMVVHASVAFLDHFGILQRVFDLFPDLILVESILSECKKLRFVFKIHEFKLVRKPVANASFLSLLLHSPKLRTLELKDCSVTGALLKEVVDDLWQTSKRGVCLSLTVLRLSNNNLSDVSGHTLAQLLVLASKLWIINFNECSMTGFIVEKFLVECNKMNADLKCCVVDLRGNNLSDMDVIKLLDGPLNVNQHVFKWRDYYLSADNLQYVLQTCHE
ncbi:uncharacterized protein LOC117113749 [Anneissia japonica]|uniref:uncharacterized protein LOC117113749 n=1 Tax=Anneissia japonica TaxID=1529436 RepID=UPI0014256935|nr:uncharacterized protein LOC117113749 [Anneissia japonica]XP_033113092.1 uncharacterized protein LOC117113749 [Anneissia japonica]